MDLDKLVLFVGIFDCDDETEEDHNRVFGSENNNNAEEDHEKLDSCITTTKHAELRDQQMSLANKSRMNIKKKIRKSEDKIKKPGNKRVFKDSKNTPKNHKVKKTAKNRPLVKPKWTRTKSKKSAKKSTLQKSKCPKEKTREMMKDPSGPACSPGPTDILCQRGGKANEHPANKRLIAMIREARPKYKRLPKHKKSEMIDHFTNKVLSGGTRVLFQLNSDPSMPWVEGNYSVLRNKISHLFRDKVKGVKRKLQL